MQETQVWFLGREDPLEKGIATHTSILAWEIPWTEEPGRLLSTGSQKIRHDWATNTFININHFRSLLYSLKTILPDENYKSHREGDCFPSSLSYANIAPSGSSQGSSPSCSSCPEQNQNAFLLTQRFLSKLQFILDFSFIDVIQTCDRAANKQIMLGKVGEKSLSRLSEAEPQTNTNIVGESGNYFCWELVPKGGLGTKRWVWLLEIKTPIHSICDAATIWQRTFFAISVGCLWNNSCV